MNPYHDDLMEETAASPVLAQADRMLRDFFKREMPKVWPALKPAELSTIRKPRRFWELGKKYLALAASLLLMIGGITIATEMLRDQPARNQGSSGYHTPGVGHRLDENGNPASPAKPKDPGKKPVPMPMP